MKIREILRRKGHDVLTIGPDRTVLEALRTLVDHNVGSLLVMDGDRALGIITERDILRVTAARPGAIHTVDVRDVMTREMVTTDSEGELHDMMTIMTTRRIRHMPVMDGSRVVGIISIGDLVNECRLEAERENTHLREYIQGVT